MKSFCLLVLEYIKSCNFESKTNNSFMKIYIKIMVLTILLASFVSVAAFAEIKPASPVRSTLTVPYNWENDEDSGSGPITNLESKLPWTSDEKFINACSENGTDVILGAYKTVLKDPIPGEEYNVHLAADMLAGKVVRPGMVFSQNGSIGPYIEEKGYREGPTYIGTRLTKTIGGGVCKISSTLYNVTVLSNLDIVERHAHSMPVPYVPYGQDATVAYGAKDFKFRNNTDDAVLIWAKGVDNVLYMALYGKNPSPEIEWRHQVLETRKAPKSFTINTDLMAGEEKMIFEGMDGAVVKSWVNVTGPNGTVEKYMGVSDYQPMTYIMEKSS